MITSVVNISRHERTDLAVDAVAVCVQPCAEAKTVLAVRRREDPAVLCMPGGKVERGETPRRSAVRELLEEAGLVREPQNLAWLGAVNVASRNGGSLTVAVFWTLADYLYVPGPTTGEPDLDPHWHDWADLADASKHGRFAGPAMLSRIEMKVKS
jgi:8-oxo-dGTP pyrophosphatase MutT (NUDIX family)